MEQHRVAGGHRESELVSVSDATGCPRVKLWKSHCVTYKHTHIYVHTPLAELLTPCHHLYWPKVQQAGQMTEAKEQANQSTSNDAGVTDGTDGPVCFLNCHQTPI